MWLSRLSERLAALIDPHNGPWRPFGGMSDNDADMRRVQQEFDAIRSRYSDHR
jgi:hypothetical protein